MVNLHCIYGECKSDSRYPQMLPPGTIFIPFPKPGKIVDGMTQWEKNKQREKTEKAKRWTHACGRKGFSSVDQITRHIYICSIHFLEPITQNFDINQDPIIATSTTARKNDEK